MNDTSFLEHVRFECQPDCANCCRAENGFVFLSENEAAAIARHLETGNDEFREWFTRSVEGQLCLVDGQGDNCVFLEEDQCLIYEVRPAQCRSYPFWPECIRDEESWHKTQMACPGIGKGGVISREEILELAHNTKDASGR